jgi:hypothetical protein
MAETENNIKIKLIHISIAHTISIQYCTLKELLQLKSYEIYEEIRTAFMLMMQY